MVSCLTVFLLDSDLPLDADLDSEKSSKIILAEMLGDMIWEDLSECLIKNCLVYSIPTNSIKLQQYEEVRAEISQEVLRDCRFLLVLFFGFFFLRSFVLRGREGAICLKKLLIRNRSKFPHNFLFLLASYHLIGKYVFFSKVLLKNNYLFIYTCISYSSYYVTLLSHFFLVSLNTKILIFILKVFVPLRSRVGNFY